MPQFLGCSLLLLLFFLLLLFPLLPLILRLEPIRLSLILHFKFTRARDPNLANALSCLVVEIVVNLVLVVENALVVCAFSAAISAAVVAAADNPLMDVAAAAPFTVVPTPGTVAGCGAVGVTFRAWRSFPYSRLSSSSTSSQTSSTLLLLFSSS